MDSRCVLESKRRTKDSNMVADHSHFSIGDADRFSAYLNNVYFKK